MWRSPGKHFGTVAICMLHQRHEHQCQLPSFAVREILVSGPNPKEIASHLGRELQNCSKWLIDNRLSLHLGKTEAIIFGSKYKLNKIKSFSVKCGDQIIEGTSSVKYLGIVLDQNMSCESIAANIIIKAGSRLKFLYRQGKFLDQNSRRTLCQALIQCHFDYSYSCFNCSTTIFFPEQCSHIGCRYESRSGEFLQAEPPLASRLFPGFETLLLFISHIHDIGMNLLYSELTKTSQHIIRVRLL